VSLGDSCSSDGYRDGDGDGDGDGVIAMVIIEVELGLFVREGQN
jgi:hypothetical protein